MAEWNIIRGDCLEELEQLEAKYDACIMDPPYAMPSLASASRQISYGDKVLNPAMFFAKLVEKVRAVLEESAYIFQFCSWKTFPIVHKAYYEAGVSLDSVMVWDKRPGFGRGIHLRPQYELIAVSFVGGAKLHDRSIGDIVSCKRVASARRFHPVEKPVELIKHLIYIAQATRVIDPFAGSGSVGVACMQAGVAYTGIECEKRYVEVARARARAAAEAEHVAG